MYGNMTIVGFTIILNFYNSFINLGKEYQDNNVSYTRLLSYLNLSEQKMVYLSAFSTLCP